MSERLLEAFREEAEHVTRVPAFELVEAAGRARRRRRRALAGGVAACMLGVSGVLAATSDDSPDAQPAQDPGENSLVTPYPGARMTTLEKGTYQLRPSPDTRLPAVRFTVPSGWNAWIGPNRFEGMGEEVTELRSVNQGILDDDPDWLLGVLALDVQWIAQRDCTMADLRDDDAATLVRALIDAPRLEVLSGPDRTVRFGHPAVHLRLRERSTAGVCANDAFITAAVSAGVYRLGPGTTYDAWVVDLGDRPLLLWAAWTRATPEAEVDDLLGIVDSIELVDPD